MQSQQKKAKYIPKFKVITEKYEGSCPECRCGLVFAEASFFCPNCGFCEKDFVLERIEDE